MRVAYRGPSRRHPGGGAVAFQQCGSDNRFPGFKHRRIDQTRSHCFLADTHINRRWPRHPRGPLMERRQRIQPSPHAEAQADNLDHAAGLAAMKIHSPMRGGETIRQSRGGQAWQVSRVNIDRDFECLANEAHLGGQAEVQRAIQSQCMEFGDRVFPEADERFAQYPWRTIIQAGAAGNPGDTHEIRRQQAQRRDHTGIGRDEYRRKPQLLGDFGCQQRAGATKRQQHIVARIASPFG